MSVKYLSETRGESQRDSTTFQEAASKATWGGVSGNLADQADLQRHLVDGYEIILPVGSYTSGTYTLPNAHEWTDYSMVVLIPNTAGTAEFVGGSVMTTAELIALNPTGFILTSSDDAADWARIVATTLTQFTISRGSNNAVSMVIGYLKPGVV